MAAVSTSGSVRYACSVCRLANKVCGIGDGVCEKGDGVCRIYTIY